MRLTALAFLILGLVGCGRGSSTGPEAPAIVVQVLDDRGAPVGRIHVIVVLEGVDRIDARTRSDGTIRVGVPEAGSYRVTVIPRAGYIGAPGTLSTSVTVGLDEKAEVAFTVYRDSYPPQVPTELPL